MADVFISYSRKDSDFVAKLAAALNTAGRDAWVDVQGIRASEDWKQKIFHEIDRANTFLFVVSPDSLQSEIANEEVSHAALNSKRMIPLFYRGLHDGTIPPALGRFQGIQFTDDALFPAGVSELLKTLATDIEWTDAHTRLLNRALEWEQKAKERSYLLRGSDLRDAEQMVAKSADREPKLTTLQSEYIVASRQSATKTQRIVIGAVVAALVVAIGLAAYAFTERNSAVARELAAYATDSLSEDRQRSMLLGMQAVGATKRYGQAVLPSAEEVLHQSFLSSGAWLTLRGHDRGVTSVAWSPDGKRLATGSDDFTAKVWDAASGQELLTLRGHTHLVLSVAWSPDGKRLATASADATAKVWDATSGLELLSLRGPNGDVNAVNSVAWSPDGKRLATGGAEGSSPGTWGVVRVWDATSAQELLSLRGPQFHVNSVAWSPDGKRLATGGAEEIYPRTCVRVWDAASGQEFLTLKGHTDTVRSVAWSPDGKRLATGSEDETAKVWDAASGQELLTLSGYDGSVNSVSWSPDGKRLATANGGGPRVWDAASGQELLSSSGNGAVNSVSWSPDGKRLATGDWDRRLRIWDVAGRQELLTLSGHNGPMNSVAWSPDGKRLATGNYGSTANVWDADRAGKGCLPCPTTDRWQAWPGAQMASGWRRGAWTRRWGYGTPPAGRSC